MYTLLNKDGFYESEEKGLFGGYKRMKIYGRLDCPSALRAIEKGNYVKYRVFFATEQDAIECGYRPCGNCMKEEYKIWKNNIISKIAKNLSENPDRYSSEESIEKEVNTTIRLSNFGERQ